MAASVRIAIPARPWEDVATAATKALLRPVQLLIAAPSLLFIAALTAMLLRPPDVQFFEIDRLAFALLIVGVGARALTMRQPWWVFERATWPMLGLTLLALISLVTQPFDGEAWSVLGAKFIVPFVLFHLAMHVFTDERSLRKFEIFAIVVLAYLSLMAISFFAGADFLIFPRFILDESLGFHADRARGPFLQAVANGVSLNLLGILALHAYRRRTARGAAMLLLLASVPIAILATMTRAVWLSFAGTLVALLFLSGSRRLWKMCMAGGAVLALLLAIAFSSTDLGSTLAARFQERGPIDYREAVYTGGWEMFLERPWLGWGFHRMPDELPRHVSGYREKTLYPHNTYLELMVELGAPGLALYLWLMWEMFRLGRGAISPREKNGLLDHSFHRLWPILLAVYWLNATVVVMSYQFVNGLLFTLAGMLAAQRRRAEAALPC
jgi:O-antigen ligase